MAIGDDFSVATNGDIRYTGSGANYTVIAFHRWLGGLMDDATAAGNDILDITDATASERSTDNIITLNSPYNIDDTTAQHLYDGSIIQGGGSTTIYDGILVFATAGAYLNVIQNGKLVTPNFWTTGLNADATNGISHRFMLKVRSVGTDIDGRRIIGQTREFGFTYSEFKINGTSRGNNVMALTYATDLNNQTAIATVKGWTTITNLSGGYRLLDVDGNGSTEPYYSEWDRAALTINQFYERTKWLSKRAVADDFYTAATGSNFIIGNAITSSQAQSFTSSATYAYVTRVHARLMKVGSPTGSLTASIYGHGGTFGVSSVPTGSQLASSVNIDVANLTASSFVNTEIGFNTQYLLTASTNYVVAFEYGSGNGSNYVLIDGSPSGSHQGNNAERSASIWTAKAASDLWFEVFTSPDLYGINGEIFRGITHEVGIAAPRAGVFRPAEPIAWTDGTNGGTGQMLAIDNATIGTKMWVQLLTGIAPSASIGITGSLSNATTTNSGTPVERTLSQPFAGQSTGTAIIGAYGIGIQTADLTASDKLFDLNNVQRIPPNTVTFTVSGLISGEDRVLVGPESAGTLQANQRTLSTTLSGGAEIAVVVTVAIPSDTPTTGTIRIKLNSGIYRRVAYTSYTGSTFTIASTSFTTDNATSGNDVFISYIDKLATATSETFQVVYAADRSLFIRVRDGASTPIKTFETTATLGSAGGSATAIRTADT